MTITGQKFEHESDFIQLLRKFQNYKIIKGNIGIGIYFKQQGVASGYQKNEFYKFLESKQINWETFISSRLLPDDAVFVIRNNTVFIIEIKYQRVIG